MPSDMKNIEHPGVVGREIMEVNGLKLLIKPKVWFKNNFLLNFPRVGLNYKRDIWKKHEWDELYLGKYVLIFLKID